ncbi:hypothetical protein BLNAU_22036 [Blattamonas nauphoetae]|uniref:Transmembrane protein n=1 Tax=Blattamonas nauphoetae TaxID=2049346 RepID=A0ABQ9WWI3_9EUKA|nr:hypothetical protein BLNAU_22036 [Blattamonas nauphoetae]
MTHQTIRTLARTKFRRNIRQKLFLVLMSCFLLSRILTVVVPFPWNYFTGTFICDQVPRFLLFVSWEFLSLWIGSLVGFGSSGGGIRSILGHGTYFFIMGVCFIISLVMSIYVSRITPEAHTEGVDVPTTISNLILYITVFVSLLIHIIRFIRIIRDPRIHSKLRRSVLWLIIMFSVVALIFFLRFLYAILKTFKVNPIQNWIKKNAKICLATENCGMYLLGTNSVMVVWEVIPSALLLITFEILKRPTKPSDKEKEQRERLLANSGQDANASTMSLTDGAKKKKKKKKKRQTQSEGDDEASLNDFSINSLALDSWTTQYTSYDYEGPNFGQIEPNVQPEHGQKIEGNEKETEEYYHV